MMINEYEQATKPPKVTYWVQLVASLAMAGLKVMPSHLVTTAGRRLRAIWDSDDIESDFYTEAGFIFMENHCRSEPHELWQHSLGEKYDGMWVVPVDEIIAITYNDPHACDYVSIQRLLFKGTEEELTTAIDRLTVKKSIRPVKKKPRPY